MTTVQTESVPVPIERLRPSDSPRARLTDTGHVELLAQLECGLPPITVHRATMRVIDGVHRLEAARRRGATEIDVVFFDGTPAEAFAHAVEKNVRHGLPLTVQERTAAAARIMTSHPEWSDRRVAATTGLSRKTVAVIRRTGPDDQPARQTRVGLDGRVRPVNSAAGREIAARVIRENPGASLREVARAAGISPSTVRDVRDRTAKGEAPVPPRCRPAGAGTAGTVGAGPAGGGSPGPSGSVHGGTVGTGPGAEGGSDDCSGAVAPVRLAGQREARIAGRSRHYEILLHGLRNDPSVRLTESGRLVLRLLETRLILVGERDRLLQAIPQHCVPNLSTAVRQCAEAWSEFAAHLETFEPAAEEVGAG